MKFRIDLRSALKDPLHGIWIGCYIGAVMIAFGPVQDSLMRFAGWGDPAAALAHAIPPAQPAAMAGGIEVDEGILQFTDHTARGIWSGRVTATLAAILISYVIGPALLVWGIRARARYRQRITVRGGVPVIAAALALGGMTFAALVPSPLLALSGQRTHAMLVRDFRYGETLDDLNVELYVLARNAQVRYHRSGDPRGGGHSWLEAGHAGPGSLHVADLLDPACRAQVTDSDRVMIGPQVFSLHVERADSLTLRGTVTCEPSSWSSANEAGTLDTLSMVVGVTPLHVNMILEDR